MMDLLSYNLSDFLLFSDETYWRLFERANAEQPLFPLIGSGIGLLALLAALWPRPALTRTAALLSGLTMLWVAIAFLWSLFRPINPAMDALAPAWLLGGLLLILFAFFGTRSGEGRASFIPAVLILTALFLYPGLALFQGQPLSGVEFIGVAPDPTAIVALALALLAARLWTRLLLFLIPAVWLLWSALTLHTLGAAAWTVPALAVLLGLLGVFRSR